MIKTILLSFLLWKRRVEILHQFLLRAKFKDIHNIFRKKNFIYMFEKTCLSAFWYLHNNFCCQRIPPVAQNINVHKSN